MIHKPFTFLDHYWAETEDEARQKATAQYGHYEGFVIISCY